MLRTVLGLLDDVLDTTVLLGYDRVGFLARSAAWEPGELDVDLTGRTCLVTGANSGLGFAAARGLAARGASVVLGCRNAERGRQALEQIRAEFPGAKVELEEIDLASQRSIRDFAERMGRRNAKLDVLVNNAGLLSEERQETEDGLELTFGVNVIGTFLLTNLLLPCLSGTPRSRVINVSSGGMYLADLGLADPQFRERPFDGLRAYTESKRAQVVFAQLWAEKAAGRGPLFFSMHPGWADTPGVRAALPLFHRMTQFVLRTPEEGADTILWLAVHSRLGAGDSGKFWFDRRPRPMHRLASTRNSESEKRRYWKMCEEISGSSPQF